MAKLWWFF